MKVNKITKIILSTGLFLMAIPAVASHLPAPTVCPSINEVEQAGSKLDVAYPVAGHYAVMTSQPAIYVSNHEWVINVVPVLEDTPEAAIAKAQQTITTISEGTDKPMPTSDGGSYWCQYITKNSFVQTMTSDNGAHLSKSVMMQFSN